jgi:hypothetical protein
VSALLKAAAAAAASESANRSYALQSSPTLNLHHRFEMMIPQVTAWKHATTAIAGADLLRPPLKRGLSGISVCRAGSSRTGTPHAGDGDRGGALATGEKVQT